MKVLGWAVAHTVLVYNRLGFETSFTYWAYTSQPKALVKFYMGHGSHQGHYYNVSHSHANKKSD